MDEVDVAAEGVGLADGELERRDLVAEGVAEGVEDGRRVGVLAVALVDDEEGRGPVRARPGATAFSVPASTPPVASTQISAESTAWNAETTSAAKSG